MSNGGRPVSNGGRRMSNGCERVSGRSGRVSNGGPRVSNRCSCVSYRCGVSHRDRGMSRRSCGFMSRLMHRASSGRNRPDVHRRNVCERIDAIGGLDLDEARGPIGLTQGTRDGENRRFIVTDGCTKAVVRFGRLHVLLLHRRHADVA